MDKIKMKCTIYVVILNKLGYPKLQLGIYYLVATFVTLKMPDLVYELPSCIVDQ